ncbi:MAG: hypothetical protein QM831_26370 [Kofleriaceae bacterium]
MRLAAVLVLAGCRFGFTDQPTTDAAAPDAALGLRAIAVQANVSSTCALSSDGRVTCWGDNNWGKLGIPSGDVSPRGDQPGELQLLKGIDFGTGVTATRISSNVDYGCAVLSDTRVKCWGNNDGSQLGTANYDHVGDEVGEMGDNWVAVLSGGGTNFDEVVTGHYHTCVRSSGSVWCWGINDLGEAGLGDTVRHDSDQPTLPPVDLGTNFVPMQLASGFNQTCALSTAGTIKCWGYGILGYGDNVTRGAQPGQMGDNLPVIPLGIGVTSSKIFMGFGTTCAITSAGAVCWGDGSMGALGNGSTALIGDDPNEVAALTPLALGGTVTQLASGDEFTCALLADGGVSCFGSNSDGQLCQGDTTTRGASPGDNLATLRVPLGEPATMVSAGGAHACAVLRSGSIACWGANDLGQLGAGDTTTRGDNIGEVPFVIKASDLW